MWKGSSRWRVGVAIVGAVLMKGAQAVQMKSYLRDGTGVNLPSVGQTTF